MGIEKDLFYLFVKHKCENYHLYEDIQECLNQHCQDLLGKRDVEVYDVLRLIINSENNAGWDSDDKHQYRMELVNRVMHNICERSEDYLP